MAGACELYSGHLRLEQLEAHNVCLTRGGFGWAKCLGILVLTYTGSHGRDNKLIVWKFGAEDEASLSAELPLDQSTKTRPLPWLLHLLEVNTMNFCSFAWCHTRAKDGAALEDEILVAVPNTLASERVRSRNCARP